MKKVDNYDAKWFLLLKKQIKEKMMFELEYYYINDNRIIDYEKIVNSLKCYDVLNEVDYQALYNECINELKKVNYNT